MLEHVCHLATNCSSSFYQTKLKQIDNPFFIRTYIFNTISNSLLIQPHSKCHHSLKQISQVILDQKVVILFSWHCVWIHDSICITIAESQSDSGSSRSGSDSKSEAGSVRSRQSAASKSASSSRSAQSPAQGLTSSLHSSLLNQLLWITFNYLKLKLVAEVAVQAADQAVTTMEKETWF